MPTVQHPFLNVFELERLLYTGKTACNHADEVWPGLYLGDQYVPGRLGQWLGGGVCLEVGYRKEKGKGGRQTLSCVAGFRSKTEDRGHMSTGWRIWESLNRIIEILTSGQKNSYSFSKNLVLTAKAMYQAHCSDLPAVELWLWKKAATKTGAGGNMLKMW
jgi:hypothetical protein